MEHPITIYRQRNELTQHAFGSLVGATKGMVSKWEAFKVLPRPIFMEKIEDVTNLEVTASELVRAFNCAITREAAE